MLKEELKKGTRVWCWWKSRYMYFSGTEGTETGYNIKTKDYTPRHYYNFDDICGASTKIYDEELEELEIK